MKNSYFDLVNYLAKEKVDYEVPNSCIDHAEDIIISMLLNGEKELNIFSGELKSELFENDRFINNLKLYFALTDGKINVVVQNLSEQTLKNHRFFKEVLEGGLENRCKFYIAKDDTLAKSEIQHFQTMDSIGYRLESDADIIKATANFNDLNETKKLNNKFNNFITQSNEIKIAA
jgi:hypothetical protein